MLQGDDYRDGAVELTGVPMMTPHAPHAEHRCYWAQYSLWDFRLALV